MMCAARAKFLPWRTIVTPLYPDAVQIPFNGSSGGAYLTSVPFRGVLHTTESKDYYPSRDNYYGHNNPPHFTVHKKGGSVKVYQHYSINVASRALANPTLPVGDVQTNRMAAIQIEICWYAAQVGSLPDPVKVALRALMRWIEGEAGIQRTAPTFYGDEAYGQGGVARMSTQKWTQFNGWCGHQHVPENAHWDPGKIDIASLL
jgi:hypothetical protein